MGDQKQPILTATLQTSMSLERTWLAYDRTVQAWIRTSISLITFGFGMQQIFRALEPHTPGVWFRAHLLAVAMVVCGLLVLIFSSVQYLEDLARLRRNYPVSQGYPPVPPPRVAAFTALVAVLGVLALFDMLL